MSCLLLVFPLLHSGLTTETAKVGLCPSYGGWSHSERHPLRVAGFGDLRYKDVCVRDMKAVDIDTMSWEGIASDCTKWRRAQKQHLKTEEFKLMSAAPDKRARRMEGNSSIRPETTHRCDVCNKNCHSNIGLFSHKRRCYNPASD